MKTRLLGMLASASVVALTCPAVAQTTGASGQDTVAAPTDQLVDEAAETDSSVPRTDIVVTGSRIVRDGTQSPTPLTVVSTANLSSKAPGSIADGLNQLPVFQGSINAAQTQVTQANRVRSGNYLNLRNLGPQRLLVLQDGYRLPPSGNNGGVDTNIIPQLLVERVEVVTGGASAVYGSDAVSGVVNYIIDKKFKGLKTLSQAGVSTYGDTFSYRIGAAGGLSLLDDRLTLQASGEYYVNEGITARGSRPGGRDNWISGAVDPTLRAGTLGSAANPFLDYRNVHYNDVSQGGYILNTLANPAGLRGLQFLPNGSLGPFNPGTAIGRAGVAANGDGVDLSSRGTLVPRTTTKQFFGRAGYDFGGGIEGFVQASYNTATSSDDNLPQGKIPGYTVFNNNVYLRQQLTPAQLAALGTSNLTVKRTFYDWAVPNGRDGLIPSNQDMESLTVMAGLKGDLFAGWKWDAIFTHGRTEFRSVAIEGRNDRFFAAADAVAGPNGQPVCRVSLSATNAFPGCIPLNTLGFGRADPAAVAWVLDESRWRAVNTMDLGGVNVQGTLFDLGAGPVSLAVGGEIRRQKLRQTSNSDPAVPVNYTALGIRGGSGGVFFNTNVGQARGRYTIKEVYAETVVPLIKDASFTKSLELNGAFRYTDYSTSGGVETYKIGATWEPITDIRLRGTYSRDIRAPSLFELFGGQTIVQGQIVNPANNTAVIVGTRSGGNPSLTPEKGTTYTLGAVLTPTFLPGAYASVDYFNIKIDDAITTPGVAQTIVQRCFENPASPFCALIDRDGAGNPTEVRIVNQNIASLTTKGVDFEVGYRGEVFGGTLGTRVLGTRLIGYTRRESSVAAPIEYSGSADIPGFLSSTYPLPKWRGNLEVNYSVNGTTIGVQERMIGSYKKSFLQANSDNTVPTVFYTDLNLNQDVPAMGGNAQFFLTVNNLFNRKGPFFVTDQNPGTQLPTARAVYDIIGRYFTVGLRTKF
ncbi:TonB-dependent receptor plug domain-containing protein [Sphingomonas profundi]|uniref:TonB-dependent receptor plug domain-containing protein n=1 Tax=Alterirhizorhabdus profundi TaxID=2681549 RepID=UPI0012E70254|nr:TonB-dependent receptor [Sphingomonas profundi]